MKTKDQKVTRLENAKPRFLERLKLRSVNFSIKFSENEASSRHV